MKAAVSIHNYKDISKESSFNRQLFIYLIPTPLIVLGVYSYGLVGGIGGFEKGDDVGAFWNHSHGKIPVLSHCCGDGVGDIVNVLHTCVRAVLSLETRGVEKDFANRHGLE